MSDVAEIGVLVTAHQALAPVPQRRIGIASPTNNITIGLHATGLPMRHLEIVDIREAYARSFERFLARRHRTAAHDRRIAAGHGHAADTGHRLETQGLGLVSRHDEHRGEQQRREQGQEEDAVPADVWIESIPFYETREYVQAVLTYRVLFQGLHGNREELVLLRPDERGTPYSLAMMD